MREGAWERQAFKGAQVAGKVLGVIGAGRIGTEVVRRARAFGMHVLVSDPFLTSARSDSLSVESVTLDELLLRSDFVTLHVPLTDQTRYLIGAGEIARMKPTACLINAARGGIVDEAALVAALETQAIAGAALDVFETEPLPADHPLRTCPNLVMTPHIGASTPEAQREVAIEIARAVREALLNGDLAPAVNLPSVAPEDRPATGLLLDLSRRLGLLLGGLSPSATDQVSVRCTVAAGPVQELVVSAAVEGLLAHRLAGPLNLINALLLAEERGIEVSRATVSATGRGRDWIEVSAVSEGERRSVAGKVTSEGEPRLLRVDAYRVEVTPSGTLLFIGNDDVPGVIGALGTHLAGAGVNIGEFHQSRDRPSGEALGVASLDGELPAERLASMREIPGVHYLKQVRLPD
jgi:D-3-phosphoglycerate dehydrogenase